MERTEQLRMREVHLQLPLTDAAIRTLELGDAVFSVDYSLPGARASTIRCLRKGWSLRSTCATPAT